MCVSGVLVLVPLSPPCFFFFPINFIMKTTLQSRWGPQAVNSIAVGGFWTELVLEIKCHIFLQCCHSHILYSKLFEYCIIHSHSTGTHHCNKPLWHKSSPRAVMNRMTCKRKSTQRSWRVRCALSGHVECKHTGRSLQEQNMYFFCYALRKLWENYQTSLIFNQNSSEIWVLGMSVWQMSRHFSMNWNFWHSLWIMLDNKPRSANRRRESFGPSGNTIIKAENP